MAEARTLEYANFSGTVVSRRGCDVHPRSISEIQQIVLAHSAQQKKVRVVGRGYSFNDLAHADDTTRVHLSTHMNRLVSMRNTSDGAVLVVVEAGMAIYDLCEQLALEHGRALLNIPNFGQMTMGGLVATGVHGTSGRSSCDTLSSSLVELEMVNGHGQLVTLSAAQSVTLGMFGVLCRITLRTVPLFAVHQLARRVSSAECSIASKLFHQLAHVDLGRYDWVMYKYLVGSMPSTLIRETFQTVSTTAVSGDDAVKLLHNRFATAWDDTKTWCKYFFPANPMATEVPWRDALFAGVCERNHRDVYYCAMMGPQVISPHAELEWCVPLDVLGSVLAEIDALVYSSKDAFFRQPIECHVRFSPSDSTIGHGAFDSSAVTHHTSWFAWVNLNVRQHLSAAPIAFEPVERILMRHGGRVHWSKCWSNSPELLAYVRQTQQDFLKQLAQLCAVHDPHGMFRGALNNSTANGIHHMLVDQQKS